MGKSEKKEKTPKKEKGEMGVGDLQGRPPTNFVGGGWGDREEAVRGGAVKVAGSR
jgi:hypothetical protein